MGRQGNFAEAAFLRELGAERAEKAAMHHARRL